jgi:glucokinase
VAVIGVDVGGTKLAGGVVGDGLEPVAVERVATPRAQDDLLAAVVALVRRLRDRAPGPVRAVGVGIPSLIDTASGVALWTVNAELRDIEVGAVLAERLALPVAVDNDANLAMLAEHRAGAAHGSSVALMLTLGTGIGSGIVVDGRVFRGSRGTGAELGHVTVQADGPPCQGHCPNRGCLETMASGTAIARDAHARAQEEPGSALAAAAGRGEDLDAPLVARLARGGDPAARAVVERAGRYLGAGLAGLANAFDPQVIVVGGGVGELGELLLAPARAEYATRALPPNAGAPVVAAAFGMDSGIVGAAMLARDQVGP